MKIAHIICRFPPYIGGMGNVAHKQAQVLSKKGHQVVVFTLPQKKRLNPDKLDYKIKYLKAWPVIGNAGFAPQLLWQLRGFDAILLHYPFFGATEIVWLAKKLRIIKGKLFIFYHMDAQLNKIFLKILLLPSKLLLNSLLKSSDRIFCASLDYIKHSKAKKIYAKYTHKFIQAPFGPSCLLELNNYKTQKIREDLSISYDQKVLLFVGGLDSAHYFKGVPYLIEAMHKLKNLNLKLIIVGDGKLRIDYEKQVKGLDLQNRVLFGGKISYHDLPCYYSLSDLVVLPSINSAEAFGLVLVEAQAFGKPAIGSNLPGVRDVVGQAGLTVEPKNADDLADKIKQIIEDENLYKQFSQAAKQQFEATYNWSAHVDKLEQEIEY